MKILIASTNKGKVLEIKKILSPLNIDFLTLEDYPLQLNEEKGGDYRKNALNKAFSAWRATGIPILAEDSGLEVDALNGAPGPESATILPGFSQEQKNQYIIECLKGLPFHKRSARFVCYAVFLAEDTLHEAKGICRGYIAEEQRGEEGFGYDPIFIPEGYKKTFAELGENVKNKISHRAKAFLKLKKYIKNWR